MASWAPSRSALQEQVRARLEAACERGDAERRLGLGVGFEIGLSSRFEFGLEIWFRVGLGLVLGSGQG
eukprot:5189253-Prorocentrum_lima.AAC.1